MTPRIHCELTWRVGDELTLSNEQHHYLTRVLRIATGQTIVLFGDGKQCEGRVTAINRRTCRVLCERELPPEVPPAYLELWLSLIKSARMDYAVQKAAELGVSRIRPVLTRRGIGLPSQPERKTEHWRTVVIHACQQCGRSNVPEIDDVKALHNLSAVNDNYLNMVLLPGSKRRLFDVAKDSRAQGARLLVGPEGGFDDDEQAKIEKMFVPVSLGPRILRAETAVVAGLTLLGATIGDL